MTYKVIALPEVRLYLTDLIRILIEKEYFSFEDNAIEYVTDLVSEIEKDLPTKVRKPAPAHLSRYGEGLFYSSFRKTEKLYGMFFIPFITTNYLIRRLS
ncbi:MAG: hypothetical protein J6W30_01015 [Bacteroidales bacterium]|nr:hypothetical protein [Bacteroidales bacterium]